MMGGGGNGGDAERWLATAEKLLLTGDLNGSKTYAIRACEADHSLVDHAELILAVADTLIAGESRIRGSTADLPDWYAVLRLVRLTHNPELVATQYSRLAVLLNPSRNRFPYSDQAFRLISDAWYVLSDPSRKALYDRELHLSQFGQLGQLGFQLFNQPPPQSPSPQHQQESPQHHQQSQQLPFQLHQQTQQHPHFAQPPQQKSQFDQQLMQSQEQQQVSWRQQFGQEQQSGSSTSGRDWKLPVEEERLINLNNATERVQPSRRFHEPDRSSSGRSSFEASSHRTPSTDLTWPSKPTQTSEHVPWQSSEPARQFQQSRSMEAAQLSLLPSVSDQPSLSQQSRSTQSHAVSKPQPLSKPFSVSQPTPTAKPFPVSQPPPASSKPLPVFQPPKNSKPFPVSQPSSTSKPFLVSQTPPASKPLPVSQPPITSKPLPVSQPPITSKPFPVSHQPITSKPLPVSQPPPASNPFPVSQPSIASKPLPVSQPPITSKPLPVSQPPPTSKPLSVSQPPTTSKPLPISQPPPTTSNPFPVSQPPQQAFQSTAPSQPPEASSSHSSMPPVFSSTQPFQPPPVSTTTSSQVPVVSTNPSPPPPVSQPSWVPDQTPATEQSPENGTARSDSDPKVPSFWTTCPYCFVLYEYPNHYEESVLQCQTKSCRRAFQVVKVPSPPQIAEEDSYYCCWGFYPIGFAEITKSPVNDLPKSAPRAFPEVTKIPFTYIPNSAPRKPSPKVHFYDDEEDDDDDDDDNSYIDSDSSEDEDDGDDDWLMNGTKKRKNVKQSKQKAPTKPKLGRPRKVIEVD
ncbi:hypothetical protein EUTSA_v10023288mg [Eutrema salsugineum]|uniref:J domain-containing protein n=1 Tax=Eutrema salsugineum TaxID=72664 RepID=V4MCT0_EUTSA|nr:uncharacterized protein LOC18009864 [Eutrema salsugineum]ESQ29001.1 hypothetical protein EUTSA_v10023288mg [Eutrema salsugineum]